MKRKSGICRWGMLTFGVAIGIAFAGPSAAQVEIPVGENCYEYRYGSMASCNQHNQADCQAAAQESDCGINPPNGQVFNFTNAYCIQNTDYYYEYIAVCQGTYVAEPQPQCQGASIPQGNMGCPGACTAKCGLEYCGISGGYCSGGTEEACYAVNIPSCDCGTPTCNCTGPDCG